MKNLSPGEKRDFDNVTEWMQKNNTAVATHAFKALGITGFNYYKAKAKLGLARETKRKPKKLGGAKPRMQTLVIPETPRATLALLIGPSDAVLNAVRELRL